MVGFARRDHVMIDPGALDGAHTLRQSTRPIKRSWLAARWGSRRAVRGGGTLSSYLGCRLSGYQIRAPLNRYPIPVKFSIGENGQILRVDNPDADRHPWASILENPASEDSLEAAVNRVIGLLSGSASQAIAAELRQHKDLVEELERQLSKVKGDLDKLKAEGEREIAEGKAPAPATLARPPEQRGRPRLSFPWALLGGHLATATAVFLEAYQFCLPYFNSTGVDISNLPAEWSRNAIGILAGSGFALAAAGGIFLLFHWAFQATASIYHERDESPETGWRRAMQMAGPGVLGGLLIAAAWGIGAMRHGVSRGSQIFIDAAHGPASSGQGDGWVFVLLTILVPLAVAYLQDRLGKIAERRRQIRKEQEAWDLKEHEFLLIGERREEPIRRRMEEKGKIERQLEAARNEIRKIAERVEAEERRIREALEAERRHVLDYTNRLAAALELDQNYFTIAANKKRARTDHSANGQPVGPARGRKGTLRKLVGSLRTHSDNDRPPVF